ncbi:MAG: hypothetical protein IJ215_05260 [Clostridia bacterium]|nr:hypothetical protein [Clostridia bacterium]
MIDIHNHTIFAVDDGSRNIEQSIRMIKAARKVGVTEICFSPHYMEDGYRTEREVLLSKVEEIQKCLKKEGIEMNLYLGEEVFIFPDMAENLDKIVSLNDSRYILFELPLLEEVNYVDEVVYRLMSLGKVPVLAHPERYFITSKDFSVIENLAQKGVLLQINLNSLIGHYGKEAKKLAVRLLKADMVQFVGSDAHSSAGYEKLAESIPVLEKLVGVEKAKELMVDNPRKALHDEEIDVGTFETHKVSNRSKTRKSLFSKILEKVG